MYKDDKYDGLRMGVEKRKLESSLMDEQKVREERDPFDRSMEGIDRSMVRDFWQVRQFYYKREISLRCFP